jgi:Flp pilus assembly protein TadD
MKIKKSLFLVIVAVAVSAALTQTTKGNSTQSGVQQNGAVQSQDVQTLLRQAQDLIRTRRSTEAVEVLRRVIQPSPT